MIDCVEECSVLKFQHGPLLRFGDVSLQCKQSKECYATYFHATDTLFYISEKGIRGIRLKENVFKAFSSSSDGEEYAKSASKPEIFHNFSSDTTEDYMDTILGKFSLNCIKLNEAETYIAFVINPETRSENDPHLIICELHRNKPFFQNHVELYLEMEDNTNDQGDIEKSYVITIQWTQNDELIVLASNGLLYLVCTKPSTKPQLSVPSFSVQSCVFILRFPKKITCFSTYFSRNVLLACAATADQIYALSVTNDAKKVQDGILQWNDALDVSVLQDTLTNVLNIEQPINLSKCFITNCQCASMDGLQWILVICYLVDEENSDSYVFSDVLHVFVTLSYDLLRIDKCTGVVLNEIQVGINTKNVMSSIQHLRTCIVFGEDICSFFLSSSCAPDIALVSSSSSLVTDTTLPYIIVKSPEAFQLCCEQVDFQIPVGCIDIIYIPKYPLTVPLTHVTLDTPPLINPSLVLLLQSDSVISCHFVDSQVSPSRLNINERENGLPQFIKPLSHFFMSCTTSHGRLLAVAQKTSVSPIKKSPKIIFSTKNSTLEETESTIPAKNQNKVIEKDSEKEKQKTVEQYITEIELSKENLNANKDIKRVLADGLRAYELKVKDLEREMKLGVPSNLEECMVNCKNQIDIQKNFLERIEETLRDFQHGPVDTLNDLFKKIVDSRGHMSSYYKIFCDALKTLKNLMNVRHNKIFSFSCYATAYRHTVQECLKYLTLLQHTSNTQLSLVQSAQREPNNLQQVTLYTESLKCIQRIKNLFYSILSLLDIISIRSENFENSVNDSRCITKEQRARYDSSGRRYALDYSVLDTLSAPEKLTDTLINTSSPVGLQNNSAPSNFHTKTLEQITSIHQRLRELQFKSRQLNYEFLSFSTLQGTEVNEAECFEENMWKLIPSLPLESNINNLLKQERYCEKSNALLLFESTREELQVSKQFLKLVTGNKKTSNFLENNFACRQEYFDFLEEEITNLQKRQTHVTSPTDPLQSSFSQLLNGIQSYDFSPVLESTGPVSANKSFENKNLCLHGKNEAISEIDSMSPLRISSLGIPNQIVSEKTSNISASDLKATHTKDNCVSEAQVSTTTDVNEQPSCADSTVYEKDKNEIMNSFVTCKDSLMSPSMKTEKISPVISQETLSFIDSTNKDIPNDIDDESSMKTSSDVGTKKSNEEPVTEKTEACVFNETKDSGGVDLTSLAYRNSLTTPFENCTSSPSIVSPIIETTTTNAVNEKLEESELQSSQSTPMQLDGQTKFYNGSTFQNNGGTLKLNSAPILESSAFERKQYSFGLDPVIPTRPASVGVQNEKNSSWAEGLIKAVPSQKVSFFDQARSVTNSTNSFPVVNDSFSRQNINEHLTQNTLMGNPNSSTFGVFGAPHSTSTDMISFGGFGAPHSMQKNTSSFGGFGSLQTTAKDTSLFGTFATPQSTSKNTPSFGSFPLTSVNPPNPFPSPSPAFGKPLPSNTSTTSNTDLKSLFSGPSVVDVGSYRIPDTMN